jgi:small subunit ribosomal protein S27e
MRMKREHILIPTPRSMFLLVQCTKCNAERVIYSHTTTDIKCGKCGMLLAKSTGGKALIHAKILTRLDSEASSQQA